MNKNLLLILLTTTTSFFSFSQNELYNNGALIYINGQSGTNKAYNPSDMPTLYVNGEVVNASGNLENATGEIQVTGDFTNNATYTTTGDEVFLGSTSSTVNGTMNGTGANNNFRNLFVVKSGAFLNLNTNTNVSNYIDVNTGIIRTDVSSHGADGSAYLNELYMLNTTPSELVTAGSGATRYIEGKLKRATSTGNTYVFPIGASAATHDGMEPVSMTINSGAGDILGYIKPATFNYNDMIFQDIGSDPSAGFSAYSTCIPGVGGDGIMDALPLSNSFPQEWVMTNPSGGAVSNYNITVNPGAILDATVAYTSVCGGTWKYLAKNGIPGGDGNTIVAGPWVPTGLGTYLSSFNGVTLAPTGNTLSSQSSFSSFRLHGPSNIGGALPVSLVSLQATPINNEFIRVNWVTATEINNKGFEVWKSTDAINFTNIGWVDAQGDGNSTTNLNYAFDDRDVVANKMYYYRLRQIDKDETPHTTSIVSASLNGTNMDGIFIGDFFPNPSSISSAVLITSSKEMDINIALYNNLSQVVTSEKIHVNPGVNTVELPLNTITEGVYHGIFTTPSGNISRQIVVTK
jgi:hypothetical protein